MSEEDPLPFGVGTVLEVADGSITKFQWMGNASFNAKGTFLPGWIDPKDKKFYFKPKPIAKTHLPYLGEHDDVHVCKEDLVRHGFGVLNRANRLSAAAREKICKNEAVAEAYRRDAMHLFLPKPEELL